MSCICHVNGHFDGFIDDPSGGCLKRLLAQQRIWSAESLVTERSLVGTAFAAPAAPQTPWLLRTQTLTPGWLRVTTWSSTLIVLWSSISSQATHRCFQGRIHSSSSDAPIIWWNLDNCAPIVPILIGEINSPPTTEVPHMLSTLPWRASVCMQGCPCKAVLYDQIWFCHRPQVTDSTL